MSVLVLLDSNFILVNKKQVIIKDKTSSELFSRTFICVADATGRSLRQIEVIEHVSK